MSAMNRFQEHACQGFQQGSVAMEEKRCGRCVAHVPQLHNSQIITNYMYFFLAIYDM